MPPDSYTQHKQCHGLQVQQYSRTGGSTMTSPAIFLLMVTNNGDCGTAQTALNLQYQGHLYITDV